MVRTLNKIMVIGNLGKDPEMKYTQSGKPVTTFSLAVSRTKKSQDGQTQEETEWFRVEAWDRLAETCNEYLKKGSKVYIEGRFQSRQYQDKEGTTRTSIEIVAGDMIMLDSRQGGEGQGAPMQSTGSSRGNYNSGDRPSSSAPRSGGAGAATGNAGGGGGFGSFDDDGDMEVDDIPF
ncbi:MAG: single-stranded DNA-binding protein [Chloroflexota bacterium]|nr:single-stranded DNA-binding protein [Chloroflexota bacterium]